MDGLTEGRMVHYVLTLSDSSLHAGEHRPAVVVKVWSTDGPVNLQVLYDGANDIPYSTAASAPSGLLWRTSVPYDPDGKVGTWHWIEKA